MFTLPAFGNVTVPPENGLGREFFADFLLLLPSSVVGLEDTFAENEDGLGRFVLVCCVLDSFTRGFLLAAVLVFLLSGVLITLVTVT